MPSMKIEYRQVSSLTVHPRQEALFRDLTGPQFEQLIADAEKNGEFDQPIEVLPDGTVVDGHQRLRAARQLDWKTIKVRVRYDLADDSVAVELRMLDTNELRKHLDPLDRVRVALRRIEIQEGIPPGGLRGDDVTRLDRRLVEMLGLSPKHCRRLRKIAMGTPMAVQAAVSTGMLAIVSAVKVADLEPGTKEEIAADIEAGAEPAEVVARFVTAAKRAMPDVAKRYAAFLGVVERAMDEFEGREGEIRLGDRAVEAMRVIERLDGFTRKLRPLLKKQKVQTEQAARDFAAALTAITRDGARHRRGG